MVGIKKEFKVLISELFYAAQKIPKLAHLIIYGSVARGEEERGSDVDILLIFDSEEDPEKIDLAKVARKEIEYAFVNAGCDRNAQITMTNLSDIDDSFIENVAREGVVVWGRPFLIDSHDILKPMTLFEYRVGGKSKVEKVRFYRGLKFLDAIRVKNGLVVSEAEVDKAKGLLDKNHIEHKKMKVWIT